MLWFFVCNRVQCLMNKCIQSILFNMECFHSVWCPFSHFGVFEQSENRIWAFPSITYAIVGFCGCEILIYAFTISHLLWGSLCHVWSFLHSPLPQVPPPPPVSFPPIRCFCTHHTQRDMILWVFSRKINLFLLSKRKVLWLQWDLLNFGLKTPQGLPFSPISMHRTASFLILILWHARMNACLSFTCPSTFSVFTHTHTYLHPIGSPLGLSAPLL